MGLWPFKTRRRTKVVGPIILRAKYDAAQTTDSNRRHWANADYLSPDSAGNSAVRRRLRSRARYEVANNSYAKGIVLTLANDVIGTGPRLQMLTDSPEINHRAEQAFADWAKSINLADKLRTMRMAKVTDGEAFALMFSNGRINNSVKLDLRLIEADQVANPLMSTTTDPKLVDGIILDDFGNPKEYHVLKKHPGANTSSFYSSFDLIKADAMIHLFRPDRPMQHRGLPDLLPALPLFAQLRRYTLAVIEAAESAANIAIMMKTNTPAGGEAAEVDPMATMEFERNMAIFAPEGWEPSQIKAEQPTTAYGEFKHEILNEIARCLNMPYNIAACNSSGYNYASGRLDHQTYYKSIRVEQSHVETVVLDRILSAWMAEAVLQTELAFLRHVAIPHQWFWDGTEHVDPAKEAKAQATRLESHTTTLAVEFARQGRDWETELRQRAKEKKLMEELGLSPQEAQPKEDNVTEDKVNEIVEETTNAS